MRLLLKDIGSTFIRLHDIFLKHFSLPFFLTAALHFIFSLYFYSVNFQWFNLNVLGYLYDVPGTFYLITLRIIFFIILILFWQFIGYLVNNYSKLPHIRSFVIFSSVYFFIMMLFQLLLWPFIMGDQMYYLYFVDAFNFSTTGCLQGVVVRYFRIYSLMAIPNISGIIIMQLLIISFIVGYVMLLMKSYFKLGKAVYLFYIPFLMPIIIQHNLHMEKDILFAYFCLLLFARLILVKITSDRKTMGINLLVIAVISSLVIAMRAEGILFFAITPAILYLLNCKIIKLRGLIVFLIFSVLTSFISVPSYVSTVILDRQGRAYKNVYMLNEVFKVLLKKAVDEKNYSILNEFKNTVELDIEDTLEMNNINNVVFFNELPPTDQAKFEIISAKLMKDYFWVYFEYKFYLFYRLRLIRLKEKIEDSPGVEPKMYMMYENLLKNKIRYIDSDVYAKVIRFFKEYNKILRENQLPAIFLITMFLSLLMVSSIFRFKRILIPLCFLFFYFFVQILITPIPNFRFYFNLYITNYLLIFYIIFYFMRVYRLKHNIKGYVFTRSALKTARKA